MSDSSKGQLFVEVTQPLIADRQFCVTSALASNVTPFFPHYTIEIMIECKINVCNEITNISFKQKLHFIQHNYIKI